MIARGRVRLPKTSRAARSALRRDCLLVLALVGGVGREGGRRRGEVGGDRLGEYLDGAGEGLGELGGDLDDQGGGRGLVGVEAEDAAPAAGEGDPGAQVVVGDPRGTRARWPAAGRGLGADGGLDLGGDRGGLVGVEDAGVLAGEQEGGGGAGLAGAAGVGAGGGEVGEDQLGGAGAQVAAVGGAAAGLAVTRCGTLPAGGRRSHQFARRSCGEADLGVGGVGALVDQGSHRDRVALAVGGDGGVAVVGVGLQQVAVDLDDRDVAQVAGGAAQARPGGAGDRDREAGDRGDLGGHGVRRGSSSRRRGRRARRGRGRRGRGR